MPRTGGHLTRELIVRRAAGLFRRKNYHSVGLDEILRSCGISKGTFYFYFESKQELCDAVIDLFGKAMRHVGVTAFAGGSWRHGIERVILYFLGSWAKPRPQGLPLTQMGLELAYTNPVLTGKVATLVKDLEALLAAQMAGHGIRGEEAARQSGTAMAIIIGQLQRMYLTKDPRFAILAIRQLEEVVSPRQGEATKRVARRRSPGASAPGGRNGALDLSSKILLDIIDERSIILALSAWGVARDRAGRKRLDILYKAAELFWERGLHATDLESILAECRVPKGSFCYYWESKRALGAAVLEFYGLRCEAALGNALDRGTWGAAVDGLCSTVASVLEGGCGLGCPLGNMGLEFANSDRAFASAVSVILQMMEDRIAAVFAKQGMSVEEAGERAAFAVALLQGHTTRALIYGDANAVSQLRRDLSEMGQGS